MLFRSRKSGSAFFSFALGASLELTGCAADDYDSTPIADRKPHDPKRPIKYPIEDLDLDPMSIHDGRILRRVNSELPTLPPKPVPNRDLLVPPSQFDTFITVWNMLNVFSCVLPLPRSLRPR